MNMERMGAPIDMKPHAYDPVRNPELFDGVILRRTCAFVIDVIIIMVPVALAALFILLFGLVTFIHQSNAVLAHDVEAHLERISAPTQITFGRHDQLTSARFAERLQSGIRRSEVRIFDGCAHAPLYENVADIPRCLVQTTCLRVHR